VRELKGWLANHGVNTTGVLEKEELVAMARETSTRSRSY
jgi:hypothetical protein